MLPFQPEPGGWRLTCPQARGALCSTSANTPYVATFPAGMHLHTSYSRCSNAVGGRLGLPMLLPRAGAGAAGGGATSVPSARLDTLPLLARFVGPWLRASGCFAADLVMTPDCQVGHYSWGSALCAKH